MNGEEGVLQRGSTHWGRSQGKESVERGKGTECWPTGLEGR